MTQAQAALAAYDAVCTSHSTGRFRRKDFIEELRKLGVDYRNIWHKVARSGALHQPARASEKGVYTGHADTRAILGNLGYRTATGRLGPAAILELARLLGPASPADARLRDMRTLVLRAATQLRKEVGE